MEKSIKKVTKNDKNMSYYMKCDDYMEIKYNKYSRKASLQKQENPDFEKMHDINKMTDFEKIDDTEKRSPPVPLIDKKNAC